MCLCAVNTQAIHFCAVRHVWNQGKSVCLVFHGYIHCSSKIQALKSQWWLLYICFAWYTFSGDQFWATKHLQHSSVLTIFSGIHKLLDLLWNICTLQHRFCCHNSFSMMLNNLVFEAFKNKRVQLWWTGEYLKNISDPSLCYVMWALLETQTGGNTEKSPFHLQFQNNNGRKFEFFTQKSGDFPLHWSFFGWCYWTSECLNVWTSLHTRAACGMCHKTLTFMSAGHMSHTSDRCSQQHSDTLGRSGECQLQHCATLLYRCRHWDTCHSDRHPGLWNKSGESVISKETIEKVSQQHSVLSFVVWNRQVIRRNSRTDCPSLKLSGCHTSVTVYRVRCGGPITNADVFMPCCWVHQRRSHSAPWVLTTCLQSLPSIQALALYYRAMHMH